MCIAYSLKMLGFKIMITEGLVVFKIFIGIWLKKAITGKSMCLLYIHCVLLSSITYLKHQSWPNRTIQN